jgi:hypothetical protein
MKPFGRLATFVFAAIILAQSAIPQLPDGTTNVLTDRMHDRYGGPSEAGRPNGDA